MGPFMTCCAVSQHLPQPPLSDCVCRHTNYTCSFSCASTLPTSAGLYGLEVDIEQLTAAKDQYEQQLEREAEALRGLKAQNEQVRYGRPAHAGPSYLLHAAATTLSAATVLRMTNAVAV